VSGAASYEVYYHTSDAATDAVKLDGDVTGTTATITGLTNGTTYYVWVKAKNSAGISEYSAVRTGVPYDPAPLTDLAGNWITGTDSYTINTVAATVTYDDGGGYGMGFTGDIKYVKTLSNGEEGTSGLIIVQYTAPPTSTYSTPNYPAGYEAIYYKGTPATEPLQFANAMNASNYSAVDTETLQEAFTAFTGTGYYNAYIGGWYGTKAYNPRHDNAYVTPNLQTALSDFVGVWDSYSDGYVISSASLEYDDGSDGQWGMNFAGDIKYVSAYSEDTGVIIINYTEAPVRPYATAGTSDYEGIYYKKIAGDSIKFANAYDAAGTDTLSLAAAIIKFSKANESTFVADWNGVYAQFKQPSATVIDMGALRGNWKGDDDLTNVGSSNDSTWLKITDYRLTVYWGAISPVSPAYSGTIVHTTNTRQDSGFIYIQFTQKKDAGLIEKVYEADNGDFYEYYYAIRWEKDGEKYRFSAYNDHDDVVNSNLDTLKSYTENPRFLEVDDDDYAGHGGMIYYFSEEDNDKHVYVGFTKQ
jgi:hypothetical protein